MIRWTLQLRALVPVWFVVVGLAASWAPTPTVPMGLLLLVFTVGIVPALLLGWRRWYPQRAFVPVAIETYRTNTAPQHVLHNPSHDTKRVCPCAPV
jgi:hypothetical protein